MKEAKEAMDTMSERIKEAIESEREKLIEETTRKIEELKKSYDFEELPRNIQLQAIKPFEEILSRAKDQRYIGNMKVDRANLGRIYIAQLNYISDNKPRPVPDVLGEQPVPKERYTSIAEIEKQVKVSKSKLENMSDVDEYLRELRQALEEKINNNYKITLK